MLHNDQMIRQFSDGIAWHKKTVALCLSIAFFYCHVWWKFSVLELSLNWCVCLVKVNSAYVFVHLQIGSAAEEPRVLCIVQDTTNAKTVNERLTLNLPASTTVNKLCEDVAHKAGYVNGTFSLTWANNSDMVRVLP